MKTWQDEQLDKLVANECEQELFVALTKLVHELGFDYCAYGLRLPLPISQPKVVLFNNYPTGWQTRYQENNYLTIDPTVQHGMQSLLPVIWSDNLFASTHEFWEEAQAFGLNVGWAQSVHNASGSSGLLTLARSHEPFTELEYRENGFKMAWLAQIAHLGMSQRLTPKLLPETEARLTPREVEILRWTAEGKTSEEISHILNISTRTVNFHIGNVIEKLDTTNKLAASVKAATLGILY